MRRLIAATAAGTLAVAAGLVGAAPVAAQDTAEVYVVHGVPGLTVDVYVDGQRALDDFAPETVAGPLDLPAGSHTVAVRMRALPVPASARMASIFARTCRAWSSTEVARSSGTWPET